MEAFLALIAFGIVAGVPIAAIAALVRTTNLGRRVRELEVELIALKSAAGRQASPPAPAPAQPHAPSAAPAAAQASDAPHIPPPIEPSPEPSRVWRSATDEMGAPPIVTPPVATVDKGVEARIATRWFNVAGIITLLFGAGFFLKYAYDNAWIGPRGRVAIGVLCGLASIIVGEISRRRGHRVFSQGLVGGGLGALYLSFFFAFRLYSLIEIGPAFALMAAVTALGLGLALSQDSLAIAILAFVGGYLTPALLSTGQDSAEFLFIYLTILALGALGTTWFRRWRALDVLAFAGTVLLYSGWYQSHYRPERLGVAVAGIAVFFVIFLLVPYGHALARRRAARAEDHWLSVGNAAFAFGFLYRMIHPISDQALGFIALAMAATYVTMMSPARGRLPDDRALQVVLGGLAIFFLVLAVPLQLGLHGITLAWAAEAVLLTVIGFRYGAPLTRCSGVVVMCLSVGRLFIYHYPLHTQPFTLIWNTAFGTWLFVCLAVAVATALYRRGADRLDDLEKSLPSVAAVAACLLTFFSMMHEVWLYLKLWQMGQGLLNGVPLILWWAGTFAVLAVSHRLDDRGVRGTALLLAALSLLPFAMVCHQVAAFADPLFGSFEFWSGIVAVGSCFAAAAWLRRHAAPGSPASVERWPTVFNTAAGVLLLVLLTVEIHSHFLLATAEGEADMAARSLKALLAVSVLWAIYATVLLFIGFGRALRGPRIAAALLFGLTLAKVYLLDVWELRQGYRILSFIVLGLLLVSASFLYSRFRSRIAAGLVCVAMTGLASPPIEAAFEPSRWSHYHEISLDDVTAAAHPYAMVTLDEEAMAGCRGDFADVRIVGRNGEETPWTEASERGGLKEEPLPSPMLNRVTDPSGGVRFEIDFGSPARCNHLVIETRGTSFRRRARVEGRDRSGRWATLVDEAWLFRLPATTDFPGAVSESVVLPENDFPRLRISVDPDNEARAAGGADRSPVEILRVSASRRATRPPEIAPLRISWTGPELDRKTGTSAFEIDLGHANARPVRLALEIAERAFSRPYVLQGRTARKEMARRGKTETGDWIEQEFDVPWRNLASGVLSRRSSGSTGPAAGETLELSIPESAVRQLRLVLTDQDSPPLTVRSVAVQGQVVRLVFPVSPAGPWRLYCGNPDATSPRYDLATVMPDVREHPPARATLGPTLGNPALPKTGAPPFSERHPWVLWVVMLGAVAVLALLLISNLRRTG